MAISRRQFRRFVLLHALLSFVYNLVVGLTISGLASLTLNLGLP